MARLPDAIKDDSPVQLTVSTIVELPYTFDEKYSDDMSGSSPNSKNFIIYVFTVQFNTFIHKISSNNLFAFLIYRI